MSLVFKRNNQQGMAAIVVVSILIVLITLISLSFARIMDRSVKNSSNNQTASAAAYAAQSGINDLATYIKDKPDVKAEKCQDLIVDNSTATPKPGPFYNDSNLSGDKNTQLTCILLNQRPTDLVYQRIPAMKSKVVKLTNEAGGSLDDFMFSWQSTVRSHNIAPDVTADPAKTSQLPDETFWNKFNYIPMLRLTLYPIPGDGNISNLDNLQNNSKTFFFYPVNGGATPNFDFIATPDGSINKVKCSKNTIGSFNGTADYDCNLVISNLANDTGGYYYAKITPIYGDVDLKIKGNDIDNNVVRFKKVQAVLDVTAKTGDSAKRLQARVDLGGTTGTTDLVPSPNVDPDNDSIPDNTIRTSCHLEKRMVVNHLLYDFVTIDSAASCGTSPPPVPQPPFPKLTFSINGIDSEATSPKGGPYQGTSYIGAGGDTTSLRASLAWQTTDATSCTASSTGGDAGWSIAAPGLTRIAGTPNQGRGTDVRSGAATVSTYTLSCNNPVQGPMVRAVKAWPPPRINSFSGPSSVAAGSSYTISWGTDNVDGSRCNISGTLNENNVGASGSRTINTSWDDHNSDNFTLTCYDPIGRIATAPYNNGNGTSKTAPDCQADPIVSSGVDGNYNWYMSCPRPNWQDGGYYYRVDTSFGTTYAGGSEIPGLWHDGVIHSRPPAGSYCLYLKTWANGWGDLNNPNKTASACFTIYDPLVITMFHGNQVWDQGPEVCSNTVLPAQYRGNWNCRNNKNVVNNSVGCPDNVHQFTMCRGDLQWSTSGGVGAITCDSKTWFGTFFTGGSSGNGGSGSFGWPYPNPVSSVELSCTDQSGGPPVTSGQKN